ncbi:unnamed protein product (macronuclear) [Paramecium tetraurelia]|uniref:non-specific serine/threonine protein kinase n=1 Tax=Paramecium tetraurelia TaxID=5888 RepID=A0CC67_PARTE|nr:uncharacterized protein GSPATT00037168001 [Paramecium tetraurelia]CAK68384.1 unnamed protein product [Paramecium tetraurelia]|eukprot:XP_001435781.1 hypothetical protein (macronuclear) [Paramecium tetraurelia strain d4-2]
MDQNHLKLNFSQFIVEKQNSYTDDYKLGGVLGVGAFSQVRKVTHRKTRAIRAMKVISKSRLSTAELQQKFINEINVYKQLDHPHILKLYEFYQDEKNYYIIIELCTGGELFDKIIEKGSFSEKEASYVMKQIMSAVLYAHNQNIVHRDLKPENILLDITSQGNYNVKVVDWGTAKIFSPNQQINEKFGTLYYMAPEVLKRNYNEKCDIWSCGVILYILLSGMPPFGGKSDADIQKNILYGKYLLEGDVWNSASAHAKDLVTKMLQYDVQKRLSAKQVLEHPWFLQQHQEKVDKQVVQGRLKNLMNFRAEQKLQQATLMFIGTTMISKEEKNQLMQAFKEMDQNGDGILTKEEILETYKNSKDHGFSTIDYTEFIIASMDRKKAVQKEKLKEAFQIFDKDGNGYISEAEIKEVLGPSLTGIDEKYWLDMIREIDKNGDGQISYDEFCEMMMKIIQ